MMLALFGMPALPATIAQAHATPAVTINNPVPLAPAPPPPPPQPQPAQAPQAPPVPQQAPYQPHGVLPWEEELEGGGAPA